MEKPNNLLIITLTLVDLILVGLFVVLIIYIIKALNKYIKSKSTREETVIVRKTLGETLKANRNRCNMTQEFVAETLGVSRQAVSKWEKGIAEPSTSNLLSLAKLYEVPAEELLRGSE